MLKTLIAGNWKMNGLRGSVEELKALAAGASDYPANVDVLVCPPATLISTLVETAGGSAIAIGGQDCHFNASGAHTGDIAAEMIKDLGASYVIVGHSERRADHGETDAVVKSKAEAALRAGLTPIICVGETEQQRKAGQEEAVVGGQLDGSLPDAGAFVVAYEPVWAIGTGLTPTIDDIAAMHGFIREKVGPQTQILYGGSVKPGNAAEILAVEHVNGALVGGASLKAADFGAIIAAAE